jgi:hypothetical protein
MRWQKHWLYAVWLLAICAFAGLHALHLRADFPNLSPWYSDWAKYTDEGWYGNAAIRQHLLGSWYLPGDFNPAPAVPVWPCLEWVLFSLTGVTIQAARGLAVAFFFLNLVMSYTLLRARGPRWMALLAVTLLVTSPFLFCFSRLAILEPLLITLTLAALNLAVRLALYRRPIPASAAIGLLFTLMMLTKATAAFLIPALAWAMLVPLWKRRKTALQCAATALVVFIVSFGGWMVLVVESGRLIDFKYLFFVNKYPRPSGLVWPLTSLWWSFHGGLWADRVLIPLAGVMTLFALISWWKGPSTKSMRLGGFDSFFALRRDPVFAASVLAVLGYLLFMTYQDHPQPRYFAVIMFFCVFLVAQGANAVVSINEKQITELMSPGVLLRWARLLTLALLAVTVGLNGAKTLSYAVHPEYTFVDAAERLTRYIDLHPNGNRLLLSVSGDQITLVTHLPTINDLFVTPSTAIPDLAAKVGYYQPGWYACWNVLDPGMLEDIHSHDSLDQVAKFGAFDDPTRNVLILFKLHPWPKGQVYDPADENLRVRFPEDKFDVPLE